MGELTSNIGKMDLRAISGNESPIVLQEIAAQNYRAIQSAMDAGGVVTLTDPGIYCVTDTFSTGVPFYVGPGVSLISNESGPVTTLRKYLRPIAAGGNANTLAICGDSYTSQSYFDGGDFVYNNADGYVTWAMQLSGQRMAIVSRPAVAGSRIGTDGLGTAITTQVDTAIASGAANVLIMAGVNDAINAVSFSDSVYAYEKAINSVIAAGARLWVCTQPGMNAAYSSYSVANQARMFAINDWLRQRVYTNYSRYGVTCVDLAAAATNPTSATGDYKTNGSQDNLHPRNVGAYYMGKELARVWSLYVPEAPQLVASNADNYGYSVLINNLVDNGLMVNGAGTATGFTGSAIAGGASTNSLTSHSAGFGNYQQMVQTAASNNDGYRLASGNVSARCSAGDVVIAECEVSVSSMTACRGVWLQLVASGTVTRASYDGFVDTSNDTNLPEEYSAVLRTPPMVISGTPSTVTARIDSNYSGAGGATVKVSRVSLKKLSG